MITEVERNVISAFEGIFAAHTIENKIKLYKGINSNLVELLDKSSDNFFLKNYIIQLNTDLRQFFSSSLMLEVTKCFDLLLKKSLNVRQSSMSVLRCFHTKWIECLHATLAEDNRITSDEEFILATCSILSSKRFNNEMLLSAQTEVYMLAKKIVQNRQTQLYEHISSILNRLIKLKIEKDKIQDEENEEFMKLWLDVWLSEIFQTDDETVRNHLIVPLETYVRILPKLNYSSTPFYKELREKILSTHLTAVQNMMKQASDWHRIWNILIRIINIEILKKATIINLFLSVVESGFRNDNLKIRAQAHICWKQMIEVFSQSGELNISKRIKLVCIPFKTAKVKTLEIAVNKFRAWWYLITQLHENIHEHSDTILVPFLEHVFGKIPQKPLQSHYITSSDDVVTNQQPLSRTFREIRYMSIISFAMMIGKSNKTIENLRVKYDLEKIDKPIDFSENFKTMGKVLISYCAEATMLLMNLPQHAHDISSIIWEGLMEQARYCTKFEHFELFIENITAMIEIRKITQNDILVNMIMNIIETLTKSKIYPFKTVNFFFEYETVLSTIKALTRLLLHKDLVHTSRTNQIVFNIFNDTQQHKELTKDIVFFLTIACDEFISEQQTSLKLDIWKHLSTKVMEKIDETQPNDGDLNILTMTVNYLNWILKNIQLVHQHSDISSIWGRVFIKMYGKSTIENFSNKFCRVMVKSIAVATGDDLKSLIELVIILMAAGRNDFDKSEQTGELIEINDIIYNKYLTGDITTECCLFVFDKFLKYLTNMSENNFKVIASELDNIKKLSTNMNSKSTEFIERFESLNSIKSQMIPKPAFKPPETNKNMNKNELPMVSIPSVWKFKPDRLTDHQKEKLRHRNSDIPALYNDMSQSQDSMSLKPWAPSKVVVPGTTTVIECGNDSSTSNGINKENSLDKSNTSMSHPSAKDSSANSDIIAPSQDSPIPIRVTRRKSISERSKVDQIAAEENNKKKDNGNSEDKEIFSKKSKIIPTASVPDVENVVDTKEAKTDKNERVKPPEISKKSPKKVNKLENVDDERPPESMGRLKDILDEFNKQSPKKLIVSLPKIVEPKPVEELRTDLGLDVETDNNWNGFEAILQQKGKDDDVVSLSSLDSEGSAVEVIINKSIKSSPELPDAEEREKDLMNSTLDLSPILRDNQQKGDEVKSIPPPTTTTPTSSNFNSPSSSMKPGERRRKLFPRLPVNDSPTPSTSAAARSVIASPSNNRNVPSLRGKAMIDLIKKKKLDNEAASPKSPMASAKDQNDMQPGNSSTPISTVKVSSRAPRDGSPSVSILKRPRPDDSYDLDSPAHKRKRVSFHDPPVSATKVFEPDPSDHLEYSARRNLITKLKSAFNKQLSDSNLDIDITDEPSIISNSSKPSFALESLRIDDTDIDEISLTPSPPPETVGLLIESNPSPRKSELEKMRTALSREEFKDLICDRDDEAISIIEELFQSGRRIPNSLCVLVYDQFGKDLKLK